MTETQGPDTHRLVQGPSQAVQKGRPARPQQATRRSVPSAVRWASERRENAAGGLSEQPAKYTESVGSCWL